MQTSQSNIWKTTFFFKNLKTSFKGKKKSEDEREKTEVLGMIPLHMKKNHLLWLNNQSQMQENIEAILKTLPFMAFCIGLQNRCDLSEPMKYF